MDFHDEHRKIQDEGKKASYYEQFNGEGNNKRNRKASNRDAILSIVILGVVVALLWFVFL